MNTYHIHDMEDFYDNITHHYKIQKCFENVRCQIVISCTIKHVVIILMKKVQNYAHVGDVNEIIAYKITDLSCSIVHVCMYFNFGNNSIITIVYKDHVCIGKVVPVLMMELVSLM